MKKRHVFEMIIVLAAALFLTLSNANLGAKVEAFLNEQLNIRIASEP